MTPSEPLPKDELFAPAGVQFKPIEKSYATAVLLLNAIWWGLVLIVILLICYFSQPPVWVWALAALPVLLFLWTLWLVPRQCRAWGYAEEPQNLYIRRGIMFKKMWAGPSGRMQYVDVAQGPIERAFGIANVSLKTASQDTKAKIPGLNKAEADRIRKLLTERGEAQRAGL